jgi:Mn-dependent DtxR family transcriptional regulator
VTASLEDCLKMVSLTDGGEARLTDIASRLGVSKPSALAALKKLEERGLVEHERYRTFHLTKEGARQSAEIRERNKTIVAFLLNIVGVTVKTAEKDACKMEHIFSDETYKKIEAMTR